MSMILKIEILHIKVSYALKKENYKKKEKKNYGENIQDIKIIVTIDHHNQKKKYIIKKEILL